MTIPGEHLPYFQRHRMDWIRETLRVFGFINRDHLMRKFGLSRPQASIDPREYQRLWPADMFYDKSSKRYLAIALAAGRDTSQPKDGG